MDAREAEQGVLRCHLQAADSVICGLMRELHQERAAHCTADPRSQWVEAPAHPASPAAGGAPARPTGVPKLRLSGVTVAPVNEDPTGGAGLLSLHSIPPPTSTATRRQAGGVNGHIWPIWSPRPSQGPAGLAAHFPLSTISELEA